MKRKDKKERYVQVRKEKYVQVRGDSNDLMERFDQEMRMARNQPKIYYSQEGAIKDIE